MINHWLLYALTIGTPFFPPSRTLSCQVLQIMIPIRHDLVQVGGSWAQRQIFNATMIEAAVRSNDIRTALGLVAELRERKPKSRTLQQLFEKLREKYNE